MKKNFVVLSFLFLFLMLSHAAYAAITVTNFTGTLIVTDPNATDPEKMIVMSEAGKQQNVVIPPGAILEILDGSFTIAVSGTDSVDVTVLDHEMTVKDATVTVQSGETEGNVTVVAGSLVIVDPLGKETSLKDGNQFPIKLLTMDEKTTEALNAMGTPAGDSAPPTDTRSMQSSPSGQ